MKPEEIIAEIVETSKYHRLVELWSLKNDGGKHLPSEILEIVQALSERISKEKKSFLFSSGLRPHLDLDTISFKVPQHIEAAKDKFDKELNEQMSVFIQLMNLIPTENLMSEPIAV